MPHYEGLDILLRGLAKARTELPALLGLLVGAVRKRDGCGGWPKT
jgi:hypothetical protein